MFHITMRPLNEYEVSLHLREEKEKYKLLLRLRLSFSGMLLSKQQLDYWP